MSSELLVLIDLALDIVEISGVNQYMYNCFFFSDSLSACPSLAIAFNLALYQIY